MVAKLIIAAMTDAEMRYASGLPIIDPFILLDTGKRTLLLSSLEYAWAKRQTKHKIVLLDPYYEAVKKLSKPKKGVKVRKGMVLPKIAALYLKERKIKKVVVSPKMRVGYVEELRKSGIRVEISKKPLYPGRVVKTKEELKSIKKVRTATVKALTHCITIIKQSRKNAKQELVYRGKKLTVAFLKKEARKILLDYACEAQEIIISHGKQTAYPHHFGSGTIKAGEPILMDFFPRSMDSGYWFDMTRTVCKGAPSPALKKLYNTVKRAQDAALQKVRAGVKTGIVHNAAAKVFEQAGYETKEEGFLHGLGHGLGLEIHEAPSLHKDGQETLKKDMIVTIEPGLYYKKIGGVRLENTVRVTTTGYEDLTRMARVLRL